MTQAQGLPFLEETLSQHYDHGDVQRIMAGCVPRRPVTLRANTLLASAEEVAASLEEAGLEHQRVSWYEDAFVVSQAQERALWDLPIYAQGKVYLQSLSSMMPALFLDARAGEDVCDMCAAPGGKTTQIAALAQNRAYITACEMHAPRAEKLEHNLGKLGVRNVTVMRTDARQLDDFFSFDRVLLDAPCSGSGTLRAGDARTAKRFTPALLQKSQKSQRALFARALKLLKPGSTLVYSTCSVLPCENDDIVETGLKQARKQGSYEIVPVWQGEQDEVRSFAFDANVAASLPVLPTRLEGALCLAPTELYEGFFIVRIRRTA